MLRARTARAAAAIRPRSGYWRSCSRDWRDRSRSASWTMRDTPASTISASSQSSAMHPVVMRDGELDRVDPREIGGVQGMLAPRPRLRFLPEQARQRVVDRIERRDRRQSHRPAAGLQRAADLRVDQSEDHQPGILRDLLQDPFEMRLRCAPSARNGAASPTSSNCASAALAIFSSVSPVESESEVEVRAASGRGCRSVEKHGGTAASATRRHGQAGRSIPGPVASSTARPRCDSDPQPAVITGTVPNDSAEIAAVAGSQSVGNLRHER